MGDKSSNIAQSSMPGGRSLFTCFWTPTIFYNWLLFACQGLSSNKWPYFPWFSLCAHFLLYFTICLKQYAFLSDAANPILEGSCERKEGRRDIELCACELWKDTISKKWWHQNSLLICSWELRWWALWQAGLALVFQGSPFSLFRALVPNTNVSG